ncbi:signal recognition particle-docking protein FtsY [Halorientalis persicus]|uniref:Signal recognition particle receptor FtsY n=1 Tax=Halorientalis persicus TaxID=1367881 RepID=A0A1H8GNQ5_9EURY|nr:signal recognition particle-docking protein FtsY [Halorientalis persicus]SEN45623.1 signal recognition particle-docking protein FtsY [Halorientalis persicus]
MFDGLKDKLNSFKENVEEEAEPVEEAEDADAETEPADAEEPAEETEAAEPETDAEPADSESEPESEADADDSGSDRGLMERAKLAATGKEVIEEDDLEGPLEELELALLSSDVEMSVAQEILRGIRENLIGETRSKVKTTGLVVEEALRDALIDVISVGQFDFEQRIAEADKPVSIIFTGVNGVGKTTTIAKLSQWLDERGYSTVLANGDTYRAGANEQLQQHADALDERLISHEQGSDPAAVIYDAVEYAEANDVDVVLGDTAGRLHTSNDLMDQLEKIDRVIDPDMTIFVDEAVAGQDAVNRAREFDDAAAIDGAVLTKADADPQGGAAISIAQVTGKPILFLGTGQDYDDLEPFDPAVIVDRLLGHDDEEPGPDEAAA